MVYFRTRNGSDKFGLTILFYCRQAEWTITTWSDVPQLPPQTILAELLETVASTPDLDGMFQAVMWDGLGKGRIINYLFSSL